MTASANTVPAPLPEFSSTDLAHLAAAGISAEAAAAQLRLLREGMQRPTLLRPCTIGDGITTPDAAEFEALGEAYTQACAAGRWMFFIPASGAATRMATSLTDPAAVETLRAHPAFARSTVPELLRDPERWASLPKALMPFHRYDASGVEATGETLRTPLEEHAREAVALAPEAVARLHFTISPEHEELFLEEVARVKTLLAASGAKLEITHSFQDPATQTIALDEQGNPFRDEAGNLLLRPGGHGSLLRNLEAVAREHSADFTWVRNIDNIPVEPLRADGRALRRALGGMLMRAAEASPDRPARIAGMVKNQGEVGGGPFWIEGKAGPEVRIVESAEVDGGDGGQSAIFRSATHFNPVDLACAVRDGTGRAFPLADFSLASSCFIAEKSYGSKPPRALKALEWPGLWNGSMAGWTTQCVEIPLAQFGPVKTVADLLREEHLGPS